MFVALLVLPGAIAHAGPPARVRAVWRWPVHGPVVGAFRAWAHAPYARGQRRGIDVAAAPGSVVRAACPGRVTFTGALPRLGHALSVRCGALVATYLRLARVTVRRGASVVPGQPIGVLGPRGVLRLGARRVAERRGYVDPLMLLRDPAAPPPGLGPAPRARGPRAPRPRAEAPRLPRARATAPRTLARQPLAHPAVALRQPAAPRSHPQPSAPLPRVAATRTPATAPRPVAPRAQPARLPWPAYPALALVATALPVGGLVRRRRSRAPTHAHAGTAESA
jgi:hypothetical protein